MGETAINGDVSSLFVMLKRLAIISLKHGEATGANISIKWSVSGYLGDSIG